MARKSKVPINMSSLLQSTTGTLAQIQSKTNSLTVLADIVRQICPDLPADAFQIANSRQDTLIIEVKSPVWGQRLQFERNTINNALSAQTEGQFQKIEIKVNPQGFQQKRHELTQKIKAEFAAQAPIKSFKQPDSVVNEKTAQEFLALAKNAPKGLKEKLEKLARVAGKK